jgi:hypothetical protein
MEARARADKECVSPDGGKTTASLIHSALALFDGDCRRPISPRLHQREFCGRRSSAHRPLGGAEGGHAVPPGADLTITLARSALLGG